MLLNLKVSLYLKNIIHEFEDIAIYWHRHRRENVIVKDKKSSIFYSEKLTQVTISKGNQTPVDK